MTAEVVVIMENPQLESGNSGPEKSSRWSNLCNGPTPSSARYIYGFIFFVTSLLAWAIRDFGHRFLSGLKRFQACEGAKECLGSGGVLRISFGCFMFFFVMFLSTVETKKLVEPRNTWHTKRWAWKILLWLGLMTVPFSLPSAFIKIYGEIAHLGAGIFLVIQLISVISFITWLNDCCHSPKNAERCRVRVTIASFGAYASSILGIITMYILYAPAITYKLNIIFISLTFALLQIMTLVSIHPRVNVGFLAPGLMGVYIVFLCWCAIRSEPQREKNNKGQNETHNDWFTIASFVIAVLAIVMATFSTGIDSKTFQFKKTETEPDDVPYGYGFFHLVFAMGAMYFAMLFVSWNARQTVQRWTIDVGWASTWVRLVNEWLAAIVYVWKLLAPVVRGRPRSESCGTIGDERV